MQRFKELLKRLDARMEMVISVYREILNFTGALKVREELAKVVEILSTPGSAIDGRTCGFIGAQAETMITTLHTWERKFLTSASTAQDVRGLIDEIKKDAVVLEKHGANIGRAYTAWNDIRVTGVEATKIREKYLTLMATITVAEKEVVQRQIKAVLTPAPSKPAPVRKRSARATNVGATTKKGSTSKVENDHGTSKDAVRRQRRRSRNGPPRQGGKRVAA